MATIPFNGFNHEVLRDEIESTLSTKLDVNRFMTRDESLALEDGMTIKIHKYIGNGEAEDLERGEKNENYIDAEYTESAYTVHRTQATAKYYDQDQMNDSTYVSTKIKALGESMVNKWTADAIAEFNKSENIAVMNNYKLEDFADAIAKYANKYEDQAGLFFLVDIALVPKIRKMLGEELRYVEDYIRTGAIGAVLGVPIYTSKAVPAGLMFLATNEAVTAFIKRDTSVETGRDIESKENTVVATKYAVIALTDESKCIKCGKAQDTAVTVAQDAANSIGGTGTNGAKVTVYLNGEKQGVATVAEGAYGFEFEENLTAGDKVKVVAELAGFVPSIAELVVE